MAYLGWIGNAILVAGMASMHPRRRWPFLLIVAGEAIWTAVSVDRRSWDMASICVVFLALAVVNFVRWGREPRPF